MENAALPCDKPSAVALGKFDALHVGHRALAAAAAEIGHPWLISFSGMAQVMGWDLSRLPLIADEERPFVLGTWKEMCRGQIPNMRYLPFAEIRQHSPWQFVDTLVNELGVAGVVAGSNYRFGYKASGNATTLQELASEMGIQSKIVSLVDCDMDHAQQHVSSSGVRESLAEGDMKSVHAFLGRPYVLRCTLPHLKVQEENILRMIASSLYLNQPPKNGCYPIRLGSRELRAEFVDTGVLIDGVDIPSLEGSTVRIEFL